MKFWAVLGRQGCREKKLPTAMSMQLFGVVFSTFCGQKELKKYFVSALKSYLTANIFESGPMPTP